MLAKGATGFDGVIMDYDATNSVKRTLNPIDAYSVGQQQIAVI